MTRPKEDQPEAAADDSEVDVTLIQWTLSLTPAERLQVLQQHVSSILELRERNAESDFLSIVRVLRKHEVESWSGASARFSKARR